MTPPRSSAGHRSRRRPRRKPKGVVDLEDFDSTLYFLDESEIHQVARELENEYRRDVRTSALNVLFDLFELEGDARTRSEILEILDHLFPNLLNARDFRTAAGGPPRDQAPHRPRQGPHPGGARAARGVRRQAERAGDRVPAAAVAGRGAVARR